jgi:energy-coupling factor transport system substrate-specific component
VVVFLANYEASRPGLRQVVPTVVLAALAAAGRILFAPIPDFKPVTAVCIIAGVALGRREGFMTGALAAIVSNIFFGQGMWTPWQMYSWGLVGYLAGVLGDRGAFEHKPVLYVFGFLSALLYGFILNSWYLVGYVRPITWATAIAAYGAGFPWDCIHGVATVVFLLVLYAAWQRKLDRIKRKFALASSD